MYSIYDPTLTILYCIDLPIRIAGSPLTPVKTLSLTKEYANWGSKTLDAVQKLSLPAVRLIWYVTQSEK